MKLLRYIRDIFLPSERNNYRPHAVSRRVLPIYGTVLIGLKLLSLFSVAAVPVGYAYSSSITRDNIITLTNASRTTSQLTSLKENGALDQAAQAKADDMLKNQYFAHTSPTGLTPWSFIQNAKYNYIIAGENLAINYYSAEGVESAWMNSPEHRANILNGNFEDIGIGISSGEYKGVPAIFVVQMFGTSLDQPYLAKAESTTGPTSQSIDPNASAVPAPLNVSAKIDNTLAVPVMTLPAKTLIAGHNTQITGKSDAPFVYIYVNGQAQTKVETNSGSFQTQIYLSPGNNTVTAAAFDGIGYMSRQSVSISLQTAENTPQILGAEVTPSKDTNANSETPYTLTVNTLPNETSVIAVFGQGQGVSLKPTDTSGQWQGQIPDLAQTSSPLVVNAYDMAGNSSSSGQIDMSNSVTDNYDFATVDPPHGIHVFGKFIAFPNIQDYFVYFAIFLLVILGAYISTRIRTADVFSIAEISGVIALAIVFWSQ